MTARTCRSSRPSTVLLGEIAARAAGAEHPPAEVRAGVAHEGADEDVDHHPLAVRQPAQQHGVGEREADPVDAEERDRHAADARARLQQRQREQHRQRGDRHQQDLVLPPVWAAMSSPARAEQPGEACRVSSLVHLEQLVHAERPTPPAPPRTRGRPQRSRNAPRRGRAPRQDDAHRSSERRLCPRVDPAGPRGARPTGGGAPRRPRRPRLERLSARRSAAGARVLGGAASKAARAKSGHSSSRNTSSE